jgi:hypothetical protein
MIDQKKAQDAAAPGKDTQNQPQISQITQKGQ